MLGVRLTGMRRLGVGMGRRVDAGSYVDMQGLASMGRYDGRA